MTAWKTKIRSMADAAALVAVRDTLGLPLGPGQSAAFIHALGERDDFEELVVFSALLSDLFRVFTRRGVQLRSGFFGPLARETPTKAASADETAGMSQIAAASANFP